MDSPTALSKSTCRGGHCHWLAAPRGTLRSVARPARGTTSGVCFGVEGVWFVFWGLGCGQGSARAAGGIKTRSASAPSLRARHGRTTDGIKGGGLKICFSAIGSHALFSVESQGGGGLRGCGEGTRGSNRGGVGLFCASRRGMDKKWPAVDVARQRLCFSQAKATKRPWIARQGHHAGALCS